MKRRVIGIFTICAFVGSFWLASYLSDHSISLHAQLNKAIHWVESLFYAEPELNQPPVKTEQVTAKESPKT